MIHLTLTLATLAGCTGSDNGVGVGSDDTGPTGGGDVHLSLSASWFSWSEVVVGFSNSQILEVGNTGTDPLHLAELKLLTNPDLSFTFDPLQDVTIDGGASESWPIVVTFPKGWDLASATSGTLRIRSDDAACPTAMIPLLATPEGYTGAPVTEPGDTYDPCA